jgi:hypothetical protein
MREQIDQRIQKTEQGQTDLHRQHPHQQSLVTARHDLLAHVVEDTLQAAGGVKGDGVGHSGILLLNAREQ